MLVFSNIVDHYCLTLRPFAHSRLDSKLIHFHTFIIRVISPTKSKLYQV